MSVMVTAWVASPKLRWGMPAGGVSTWLNGADPSGGGWKKLRLTVTGPRGTVWVTAMVWGVRMLIGSRCVRKGLSCLQRVGSMEGGQQVDEDSSVDRNQVGIYTQDFSLKPG